MPIPFLFIFHIETNSGMHTMATYTHACRASICLCVAIASHAIGIAIYLFIYLLCDLLSCLTLLATARKKYLCIERSMEYGDWN